MFLEIKISNLTVKSAPFSVSKNMLILIFLTLNSTMPQTKFDVVTPVANVTITFPAETQEIKELLLKTKLKLTCRKTGLHSMLSIY